jgi:NAD(P)-dependent dehydrogenase (short-subunit alcohol dehydrogenase family)
MVALMGEGGVVILTGSIAPRKGQPGTSIYGASKGAVRALTRGLASELLEKGIRVNCLSPGPVATPIFSKIVGGDESATKALLDRMVTTVPLGRLGSAEEIAQAVLFLAGSGAAYMIGSELVLDGGKTEL